MEHDGDDEQIDLWVCEDPDCETLVARPARGSGGVWPLRVKIAVSSDY